MPLLEAEPAIESDMKHWQRVCLSSAVAPSVLSFSVSAVYVLHLAQIHSARPALLSALVAAVGLLLQLCAPAVAMLLLVLLKKSRTVLCHRITLALAAISGVAGAVCLYLGYKSAAFAPALVAFALLSFASALATNTVSSVTDAVADKTLSLCVAVWSLIGGVLTVVCLFVLPSFPFFCALSGALFAVLPVLAIVAFSGINEIAIMHHPCRSWQLRSGGFWLLATISVLSGALYGLMPFGQLFIFDILGSEKPFAIGSAFLLVFFGCSMFFTPIFGALAANFNKTKIILVASVAITAVVAWMLFFVKSTVVFLVVAIALGLASAMYLATVLLLAKKMHITDTPSLFQRLGASIVMLLAGALMEKRTGNLFPDTCAYELTDYPAQAAYAAADYKPICIIAAVVLTLCIIPSMFVQPGKPVKPSVTESSPLLDAEEESIN